jgi:hypothetical protein
MATPGQLVHSAAKILGIPEATVVQYDRNLAGAGLRSSGGRGRSAAQVTSQDAANLLIAICGAPISGASVKEAHRTCERYRSLRAYGVNIKSGSFSRLKSHFPTLGRLPERHLFGDAIAGLIDSIAAGEFGFSQDFFRYPNVDVHIDGPHPEATIVVDRYRRVQLNYRKTEDRLGYADSDFRQVRSFSFATLYEIAKVVGGRVDRHKASE